MIVKIFIIRLNVQKNKLLLKVYSETYTSTEVGIMVKGESLKSDCVELKWVDSQPTHKGMLSEPENSQFPLFKF